MTNTFNSVDLSDILSWQLHPLTDDLRYLMRSTSETSRIFPDPPNQNIIMPPSNTSTTPEDTVRYLHEQNQRLERVITQLSANSSTTQSSYFQKCCDNIALRPFIKLDTHNAKDWILNVRTILASQKMEWLETNPSCPGITPEMKARAEASISGVVMGSLSTDMRARLPHDIGTMAIEQVLTVVQTTLVDTTDSRQDQLRTATM